jgi:transcriptional regulator with XRE-family HTH domain
MLIGERLRSIREEKKMSQGHIERKTGLLRCYVSRVENGHTTPSIDTLEKWTRALGISIAQLFADGDRAPADLFPAPAGSAAAKMPRGMQSQLQRIVLAAQRMSPQNRNLLLMIARKMARAN